MGRCSLEAHLFNETAMHASTSGLRVMTQKQHFLVMEAGNSANNNNRCHCIKVFVACAPVVLNFSLQGPDCCLFFYSARQFSFSMPNQRFIWTRTAGEFKLAGKEENQQHLGPQGLDFEDYCSRLCHRHWFRPWTKRLSELKVTTSLASKKRTHQSCGSTCLYLRYLTANVRAIFNLWAVDWCCFPHVKGVFQKFTTVLPYYCSLPP